MASSSYVNDECVFDASWSLYSITTLQWVGQNLRDPSVLARPARELDQILQRTSRGGAEYDEEDSDRAGGYQSSVWKIIRAERPTKKTKGLLVTVKYDRSTYKAILLLNRQSPTISTLGSKLSLLMLRMPATLSRRFIRFFENSFSATFQPLKFPTTSLCQIFESYITTLSTLPSARHLPSYNKDAGLQDLPSLVIRDLRITLNFLAPVTPHLRALDIDIPFDSFWKLVSPEATLTSCDGDSTRFFDRLAGHIDRTLGLALPWKDQDPSLVQEDMIRIARISSSSLVIAADGKMKLVGKFSENVHDEEMVARVKQANDELLDTIVRLAAEEN